MVDKLHDGNLIFNHLELCGRLVPTFLDDFEGANYVQLPVFNLFNLAVASLANCFLDFIVHLNGVLSVGDQHSGVYHNVELLLG